MGKNLRMAVIEGGSGATSEAEIERVEKIDVTGNLPCDCAIC
jgi:hypothetical protein